MIRNYPSIFVAMLMASLIFFSCNIFNNSESTPPSIVGGWELVHVKDEPTINEKDFKNFLLTEMEFSTEEAESYLSSFIADLPRPVLNRVVFNSDLVSYRSRRTPAEEFGYGELVLVGDQVTMKGDDGSQWHFTTTDLTQDNLTLTNSQSRIIDVRGTGQTHTVKVKTAYYLTKSLPGAG